MVMNMNKREFIIKLKREIDYEESDCILISEIIERYFLIGNKDKIIHDLKSELNINQQDATNIYTTAMNIIGKELKYKIKHPFHF